MSPASTGNGENVPACTPRASSQSRSETNVDFNDWQNQSPSTGALPVTLDTAREVAMADYRQVASAPTVDEQR